MKTFQVHSGYRQFYVADIDLDPDAPEEWDDSHISQRHNTLKHITALVTEGDITAEITSCGPSDTYPSFPDKPDFDIRTEIKIQSGRIGVFGWPRELFDEYSVQPGIYAIHFRGYALAKAEAQRDYYGVQIQKS